MCIRDRYSVLFVLIIQRTCVRHPDNFCYVCDELTFKSQRRNFTPLVIKCYVLYFGCQVGDFDKSWAPNIWRCVSCVRLLAGRNTLHSIYNSHDLE